MGINGKAGHGRGNNRKRPFRRRENDSDVWQKGNFTGWESNRQIADTRPEMGGEPGKISSRAPENQNNKNITHKKGTDRPERASYLERPKWTPPKMKTDPLPVSSCHWCGKPIRDMSSAIADKDSGAPVHFDCVISRITFGEKLEKDEAVTYIGGGRFGVITFNDCSSQHKDSNIKSQGNLQNTGRQDPNRRPLVPNASGSDFIIKKIIEWEDKDKRAEWRAAICDQYSVT